MYSITSPRFRSFRIRHLVRPAPHRSHADFVADSHRRLQHAFLPGSERETGDHEALIRIVLGLTLRLESEAMALLLPALEKNHQDHLILRADRNLQLRTLELLAHEREYHVFTQEAKLALEAGAPPEERHDISKVHADELAGVVQYRKTFAALLATGSQVLGLEGDDRCWFERRLDLEEGVVRAPDEVVAGKEEI